MTVLSVQVDEHRASVVLRPSWIARLFGARDLLVLLVWDEVCWVSATTRDRLGWIAYSAVIKRALL